MERSRSRWIDHDESEPQSYIEYNEESCRVWHGNFLTLVDAVVPRDSSLWTRIEQLKKYGNLRMFVDEAVPILLSVAEDIECGLLRKAEQHIEAAVTVDYLDMAERLIAGEEPGQNRHIPAVVLAGAVFEHGLRSLALRHNLPVFNDDGKPLMLNGLIDVVKKANVVTELDAKSMRAWAGIRNAAAHGQFAEVTEAKAKELISGVTAFLAANQ